MLREQASRVHLYPDASGRAIRAAIATHENVDPEWVIPGHGSVELIENVAKAYLDPGLEAVMAVPTFLKFQIATEMFGATPIRVPTVHDRVDLDGLATAIGPRTRLVYLASPDNPTAQMNSAARVAAFLESTPKGVLTFLDQAYYEYVVDESPDIHPLLESGRIFVSRTFSKAYGLAGLRIGYGLAHPDIIRSVERVREHFNTSLLAQGAAITALGDQAHLERVVSQTKRSRQNLRARLLDLGFVVGESFANFLLVRHSTLDGASLAAALLERGVIVRPLAFAGIPDAVRISIGTPAENEFLLQALRELQ